MGQPQSVTILYKTQAALFTNGGTHLDDAAAEPRKFYVVGGEVEVIGHLVSDLDANGKKLQVVPIPSIQGGRSFPKGRISSPPGPTPIPAQKSCGN